MENIDTSLFAATAAAASVLSPPPLRNILAFEADRSSRHDLVSSLSVPGLNDIRSASSIEEALAFLRGHHDFDLIVCDPMPPDAAGAELVARLRAAFGRVPILVVLPKFTVDALALALRAGADDCVQKSADARELRDAVSTLIARFGERERGSAKPAALTGAKVEVTRNGCGAALVMTASTDSAQIESFQRIAERLAAPGLAPIERMHFRQALEEVVQNAREWGNRFDARKTIRLECVPLPDRIVFSVEDQGDGFDPDALHDPSIDPKAHIKRRIATGKRMGGWGIFIARKRMDEVTFNEKGNVVHLMKLFGKSH